MGNLDIKDRRREEGLPCEERRQQPATKHRKHPSCKVVVNVQRCWGRRESNSPDRGVAPTAKLGMSFQRQWFHDKLRAGDGFRGHLLFYPSVDMYQK
jgi:hypothetical protein